MSFAKGILSQARSRLGNMHAFTFRIWVVGHFELALLVAIFLVGLAIRIPNLMLIPRFEDEGSEVLWALDIASGKRFPLTGVDAYYGPLFYYLVAVLFRVFGASVLIPRLMVAVFGGLTGTVVYLLGRVTGGYRAGLLAAVFTISNPILVIVSSHYGWSNSLTPFFSTLTLLLFTAGVGQKNGVLLAASGFAGGLMLQTHPISIVLLVAVILWSLFERSRFRWLTRRETFMAFSSFFIGYVPSILANFRPDSPMVEQAKMRSYALSPISSIGEYIQRLSQILVRVEQDLGGNVSNTRPQLDLVISFVGLIFLVGIIVTWRLRSPIPFMVVAIVLLLPIFLKSFFPRYLTFLIPLADVCIGCGIATGLRIIEDRHANFAVIRSFAHHLPTSLAVVLVSGLATYSLATTVQFYGNMNAKGQTNEAFFGLTDILRKEGICSTGLMVEDSTRAINEAGDSWALFNIGSIRYVLVLNSCAFTWSPRQQIIKQLEQKGGSGWIIIPAQSVPTLSDHFDLQLVASISPAPWSSAAFQFALYNVTLRR